MSMLNDILAQDNLGSMLQAACQTYGSAPAVVMGGEARPAFYYDGLAARSREIAVALRSAAVGKDSPVIVLVGAGGDDVAAMTGCWLAGSVVVPLHVGAPPAALASLIDRTGACVLLRNGELELVRAPSDSSVAAQGRRDLLDGAAFIIFTSGTTGLPKGVVLGHSHFMSKLRAIQATMPFAPGASTMMVLKLNFSFGLWVTLLSLATGGTVEIVPRFDALETLRMVGRSSVARIAAVPTMMRSWRAVTKSCEGAAAMRGFAAKREPTLLIAGGEPLSAELGCWFRSQFPRCEIADVFGLTETSTSDAILLPHQYDAHSGTIGWPTPGVSIRIVGEHGRELGAGEPGELYIRSDHVMRGYLDDPVTTSMAFDGDFLKTGDTGMLNVDGSISLLGRSKELIVRGGTKVSPLEVERIFVQHPAVSAALAAAYPHPILGEGVGLLVVPAPGAHDLAPDELTDWARGKIESYKIPDRYMFAVALPVGQTGKADRRIVTQWLAAASIEGAS